MAKKKKSKKSKAQAAAAKPPMTMTNQVVARSNNANVGDFPYDSFEAALRRFAHPTAVADLDLLARGGPDWMRFLEAFGNSINDLSMMFYQPDFTGGLLGLLMPGMTSMMREGCPLLSAFAAWKGQQCLVVFQNPSVYYNRFIQRCPDGADPYPQKSSICASTR